MAHLLIAFLIAGLPGVLIWLLLSHDDDRHRRRSSLHPAPI
jgi:hypothetical protein